MAAPMTMFNDLFAFSSELVHEPVLPRRGRQEGRELASERGQRVSVRQSFLMFLSFVLL